MSTRRSIVKMSSLSFLIILPLLSKWFRGLDAPEWLINAQGEDQLVRGLCSFHHLLLLNILGRRGGTGCTTTEVVVQDKIAL